MNTKHVPACVDCKHFYHLNDEGGQCRRYAPRPGIFPVDPDVDAHGDTLFPDWPQVMPEEWCGEFYLDETVLQEQEQ